MNQRTHWPKKLSPWLTFQDKVKNDWKRPGIRSEGQIQAQFALSYSLTWWRELMVRGRSAFASPGRSRKLCAWTSLNFGARSECFDLSDGGADAVCPQTKFQLNSAYLKLGTTLLALSSVFEWRKTRAHSILVNRFFVNFLVFALLHLHPSPPL